MKGDLDDISTMRLLCCAGVLFDEPPLETFEQDPNPIADLVMQLGGNRPDRRQALVARDPRLHRAPPVAPGGHR